ncbi:hypothetical protein PybrP1_006282 [[Pythium] brassicae (nom. inval.)]|nr:hypothetical protein PybrP1_006282 [[Pythium] brassicae (nom. inval.)]
MVVASVSTAWLRMHVLYVVSFLDLMAVSMIIPSLASHVKAMDGGALGFGVIMSVYGLLQVFAAPLAGSLSDALGRRRVLLACIAGAGAGYALLGLAWNVWLVALSRVPCALFKHTLDLIKVAVADAEQPAARSAAIGRLNAAANAGFILGPVVGGYVSALPHGFHYTALLTAAVFALNYALVALFFRDECARAKSLGDAAASGAAAAVDWPQMLRNSRDKLLEFRNILRETGPAKTLLVARLLLAMAAILYRTHFSVLLEDKFGTDAKARGFLLSYMGVLGTVGSFAVGFATRLVRSERLLLQLSSLVYVATFVALSKAASVEQVYVLLVPQVVAISMLRASSIGLQTTFVSQERVGAFMGVSSSLTSIGRTICPLVSGWTYMLSVDGPAYGAALLAGTSAAMFCFSPHFARIGDAKWAAAATSSASSSAKRKASSD